MGGKITINIENHGHDPLKTQSATSFIQGKNIKLTVTNGWLMWAVEDTEDWFPLYNLDNSLDDVVIVRDTQPTEERNKLWVNTAVSPSFEVPTMEEFLAFVATQNQTFNNFAEEQTQIFNNFADSEAQKLDAFAESEAQKLNAFKDEEATKFDAFAESEAQKFNTFSKNEAKKFSDFAQNESAKFSAFTTSESQRFEEFSQSEEQKLEAFKQEQAQSFNELAESQTQSFNQLVNEQTQNFSQLSAEQTQSFNQLSEETRQRIEDFFKLATPAYDLVVANGYEGTQEDFARDLLAALQGGGGGGAPSDWAENDETQGSYVKNRTHWKESGEAVRKEFTVWGDSDIGSVPNWGSSYYEVQLSEGYSRTYTYWSYIDINSEDLKSAEVYASGYVYPDNPKFIPAMNPNEWIPDGAGVDGGMYAIVPNFVDDSTEYIVVSANYGPGEHDIYAIVPGTDVYHTIDPNYLPNNGAGIGYSTGGTKITNIDMHPNTNEDVWIDFWDGDAGEVCEVYLSLSEPIEVPSKIALHFGGQTFYHSAIVHGLTDGDMFSLSVLFTPDGVDYDTTVDDYPSYDDTNPYVVSIVSFNFTTDDGQEHVGSEIYVDFLGDWADSVSPIWHGQEISIDLIYSEETIHKIEPKYIGTDWSVNDKDEPGYVENRTHWKEGDKITKTFVNFGRTYREDTQFWGDG